MKNPIIENRIIDSITFATRFRSFLDGIEPCDACSEEELEYLTRVADKLVAYQRATCPESEKWYFSNIGKPIGEHSDESGTPISKHEISLQEYYNSCNALLKVFCEKHGFDYEEARGNWVANDAGCTACCGDFFFNMDVIVADLSEDAPKEELLKWYDYEMRCGYLGVTGVNYRSWLKGCPVIPEEKLHEIESAKKRVDEAKEELMFIVKEYE